MTGIGRKKILVADDDPSIRTVLSQALRREGYDVSAVDSGAELFRLASAGEGDLVITDVMMPGESGLDLLPKLRKRRPDMKVIVMSARNALTMAVTASERGALDFLPKPFEIVDVLALVARALEEKPAQPVPQDSVDTARVLDKTLVVGQSRAMQEIYLTIARLRNADLTVLITGESGTGKELIARALHGYSGRKAAPFVALNVAAIPRELIESELFGHEKGAFTGATQRNTGRFVQADGGTLFLDEIGDMPYEAQTRLLRVLQEGEFMPVGGHRSVKADVRIIAATNRDLRQMVHAGSFREDLYYRLNVIQLHVPPLRDRREDIPGLVQHFIAGTPKVFDPAAMKILQEHAWRGNIRELENFTKRLCALCPQDIVTCEAAMAFLAETGPAEGVAMDGALSETVGRLLENYFLTHDGDLPPEGLYDRVLREIERPLILRTLAATGGNQIRAAEVLGLNRNTLRKKIRELEIEVKRQ